MFGRANWGPDADIQSTHRYGTFIAYAFADIRNWWFPGAFCCTVVVSRIVKSYRLYVCREAGERDDVYPGKGCISADHSVPEQCDVCTAPDILCLRASGRRVDMARYVK